MWGIMACTLKESPWPTRYFGKVTIGECQKKKPVSSSKSVIGAKDWGIL